MRTWCIAAIAIKNDVCDCMQNWTGGDCSGRVCPFTRAWQDTAEADDDAHYYAECGNRGVCDREKGLCECDEPFTGSGCRRMGCPADCSGHGTCEFIEELAGDGYYKRIGGVWDRKYTLWDQEKIMGCRCDPGFEGYNCAKRVCPKGDDPLTPDQYEMKQAVVINEASIEFFLTYHDPYGNAWVTEKIVADTLANAATTCGNIQTALRRLPNNVLNSVIVDSVTQYTKLTRPSPISTSGTLDTAVTNQDSTPATDKVICVVSFQSEPGTTGYQNLLECDISVHTGAGQHPVSAGTSTAATTCLVVEVADSATTPLSELVECSNRGTCDYTTGTCKCFAGHMGMACQTQEALV